MGCLLIVGADGPHVRPLVEHPLLAAHDILTCRCSVEALRHARTRPIDVLLTDPATSIEEDLQLVEEMRAIRGDVRTIALAPAFSSAELIEALRAKVFACFSEPFDITEIAEMVRAAIEASNDGIEVISGLPNWLTLRVACRLVTADRLTRFLTELRGDLPSDERDLLMTAFREVLVNAMEHGAGFDPSKVIQVTAARTARAIVFHFRDPGDGFDQAELQHAVLSCSPESVMAATVHRAETGLRPGGFGMLIVRQVVDELVYNERGNEVIMIKHTA
jgi:anti-sigma regulatory factor (Ser/Thr protein kinase)/ActR/RegA family two-component response regulator